jgi:HD-like signal output (HDOD) protein
MAMPASSEPANAQALQTLIGKVNELAVLPHVVFKVLELSGSGDFPAQEMERAIIVDPGFTSRLLTLANSAFYGLPRKVGSIREAITFLGFKAIRQMAMTVGVFDLFVGKNDADSLRRRAWWRHSVDSAVCSKHLAQGRSDVSMEDAYTSGLIHWIGKTLLDRFGAGEYRLVEQLTEKGVPILQAEQAVFGCDHVVVSVAAATKWGFPDNLVGALDYVTEPGPDDVSPQLRSVVAIADIISQFAMEGLVEIDSVEKTLPQWAMDALNLPAEDKLDIIVGAGQAIAQAAQLKI